MKLSILSFLTIIFFLSITGYAQNPAKWSISGADDAIGFAAGKVTKIDLKAEIEAGWHLYGLEQADGGPVRTTIKVTDGKPFVISGEVEAPKPTVKADPNFGIDTKYYEDQVVFGIPVKATSAATRDDVSFDVRFQLCNDTFCLPPRTVRVSYAGVEDVKRSALSGDSTPEQVSGITVQATPAGPAPSQNNQLPSDTFSFLWLAVTLGALSLLTPCVFPMIPITVSYFANHAGGNRARSVKLATVYSLGIIATFTLVGMLLALFVGAAGINLFAANPWVNLLITGIFLFFAFNLFGAYEISVPTGILTKLDSLTRSKEGEGSGVVGALLMGLTFTLTSFTCTSPFVGTILVSASQGSWKMPLLGMLAFSAVFALPFFLLALMPQLISQLPRAGGWMNSIKVAMGFLEVAAAMKFISNVDLVWKWGIFTRSVVLAIWIAIGIVLAVYLLGKFQLSHDSKPERLGAFRMISAVAALAVSFYLLTGLFGAKLGEVESFLPPDLSNSTSRFFGNRDSADELKWISNDYDAALARAKAENKRVFIDFTGYTCTNCRWMEANVFVKKEVEDELRGFVLARLYTDGEGEIYERQQKLEEDSYKTVALPYYAIVSADGSAVSSFPGLTRNASEFVDFLKKAQKN